MIPMDDDEQPEKEEEKQPELPKEESTNIITQPTFPPAINTQSVKNSTNNNPIGLSSNLGRMHLDEITSQAVDQASIKGPAGTKKSRQLNKP